MKTLLTKEFFFNIYKNIHNISISYVCYKNKSISNLVNLYISKIILGKTYNIAEITLFLGNFDNDDKLYLLKKLSKLKIDYLCIPDLGNNHKLFIIQDLIAI